LPTIVENTIGRWYFSALVTSLQSLATIQDVPDCFLRISQIFHLLLSQYQSHDVFLLHFPAFEKIPEVMDRNRSATATAVGSDNAKSFSVQNAE
jgi:hypothetical protein